MKTDWWEKIEDAYHRARDLRGEERARFLDDVCASDAAMRRQIEELLQQDDNPSSLPRDIYVSPLFGDRKAIPITQTRFDENEPHFSFDGKWLAYDSNESGTWQVYVVSFPALDQRCQVSASGGGQPRWRRDGKELYYLAADGKLMAVNITAGLKIDCGPPQILFDTGLRMNPVLDQYAVAPDGQRFLVLKPQEVVPTPLTVVLNWDADIQK